MTDLSERPGQLPPPAGDAAEPAEDLDETVFRSVAEDHDQLLQSSLTKALDAMARDLMESDIGGVGKPKVIEEFTTGYRDDRQAVLCDELAQQLSAWTDKLNADGQVRLLVHLWRKCFDFWNRSLGYRTIKAVADAVAQVAAENVGARERNAWQQEAWRAAGTAFRVFYLDGLVFKQMNLSCAEKVHREARDATAELNGIRDDLDAACRQLAGRDGTAWQKIRPCLSYMRKYTDQIATYFDAMTTMADALAAFEDWLARARPDGARGQAVWPASLDDAPRGKVVRSLEHLEEVKGGLSSYTLSEIEPWEQMLIGLRDLMSAGPDGSAAPSVLIPRQVWVRYCYPFAVDKYDAEHAERLLRAYKADDSEPRAGTARHSLAYWLKKELDAALPEHPMDIGEPENLAQTQFFQSGEQGHFGGIRIQLPDLVFIPDFIDGDDARPYRAWLDLNRMGNFCLCVEATQPLERIPPPRLYRALRAGTPFVFGEPVHLAAPDARTAGKNDSRPLAWDNLYTYAQCMIKAAAGAYSAAVKEDTGASSAGRADYIQGNLHEVVVVQTDAPIDLQAQDIARRLDSAVGGRILLRSVQRGAATLEDWTRFPPVQHHQASTVLAVPEIGYAGDWFVHTGETTVFGIVAVPAWFRDVYPEAAQFASSWSPVLQLWNRRLQAALKDAISDLNRAHDSADDIASDRLRRVEQQVRQHLASINADELCATLAYRRFLDSVLDAVGIRRLEKELQTQLQAAEQLADYSYQRVEKYFQAKEKEATKRRDILLFFITLLGVFSLADFLALLDTTNYDAHIGFIRLSHDGRWQDVLVLVLVAMALIGGAFVWGLWRKIRELTVRWRKIRERKKAQRKRSTP